MSKVIWVTGVAGFTGRHLAAFLNDLSEELQVVGLDVCSLPPDLSLHAYHELDLCDREAIKCLADLSAPDVVFHLAGLMPPHADADMWQVNVGGTLNLIQVLAEKGLKPRVVCIGSAAEYLPTDSGLIVESNLGPGYTGYGRVKWAQTSLAIQLAEQYEMDLMIARPFNLIGPGLPNTLVAAQFCEQFARTDGADIKVGNTASERDFVDIRDAVSAYWQISIKGCAGEVYNVCTGKPTQISELLDVFFELSDGAHEVVVDQARFKGFDANSVYGSFEKLHGASGWQPQISLKDSLIDMYNEEVSGG